ncbi:MAG: methyltransferase domain-containing protein [Deltaproteobacteria bacterium]|nr:methyltransferase domain-containing protein [Deltaproteobacteria bacterium]
MTTQTYYNTHAKQYSAYTKNLNMTTLYPLFLKHLTPGGTILDCGCGSGRDTLAFCKMGYNVTAMDGSEEMCKIAAEYTHHKIHHKHFCEINWVNEFDGVWACASLLHLTRDELDKTLPLIFAALKSKGAFYASFKHGAGERLDDLGRFYTDYSQDQVRQVFGDSGFVDLNIWISKSQDPNKAHEEWVNVVCKK